MKFPEILSMQAQRNVAIYIFFILLMSLGFTSHLKAVEFSPDFSSSARGLSSLNGARVSQTLRDLKPELPKTDLLTPEVLALVQYLSQQVREGGPQTLNDLFYHPNWQTWSMLYTAQTGEIASAFSILTWINRSRNEMFCWFNQSVIDDSYQAFYFPALLDQMSLRVYGGCWGFLDKPADAQTRKLLLNILGDVARSQKSYDVCPSLNNLS